MNLSESARAALHNSKSICVLTGAGVSAESGVATFRGKEGLWSKFQPEELANFDAFMRNPELVWEWYQYRRAIVTKARPNSGHEALAQWESKSDDFTLITQNVDGFHQRAGSRRVIELHGNILRNRCLQCGNISDAEEVHFKGTMPLCTCDGRLRPDVVWFGEMLPEDALDSAYSAAEVAELFLSVGTSAVVHPAASLPEIAKSKGAFLIEINVEPTVLTPMADLFLEGLSGKILPELFAEWMSERAKAE